MISSMENDHKLEKDIRVLETFIECYCRGKHNSRKGELCADCAELLRYSRTRREKCPLHPKPACKHCPTHCYGKRQLAEIRTVMAYSGKRLLLRGRLDLLWHYFF